MELARQQGGNQKKLLLDQAKGESFQFVRFDIPPEGKTYTMGSPKSEIGREKNEFLTEVTLKDSFEIQATPLTVLQKKLLLGEELSRSYKDGNLPDDEITWLQAHKLIARLNELDPDYTYRLPWEAEWEYAARAGTQTRFSFGDSDERILDYAVYTRDIINGIVPLRAVASRKPNPAGLYDVHGNVHEWCADRYLEHAAQSGVNKHSGNGNEKAVLRSGGTNSTAEEVRSAHRFGYEARHGFHTGIRLVRQPKKKTSGIVKEKLPSAQLPSAQLASAR
jgi:formylglycine-generating enzyme required for sulfatase activity